MHSERPQDPEGPAAMGRLPRELDPPPRLEESVVAELFALDHLQSGRHWRRRLIAVAAALLLFAAGAALGTRTARPTALTSPAAASGTRYVLLLYEGAGFHPSTPGEARERVEEYGRWAGDLSRTGTPISGEKLQDAGISLALSGGALARGSESVAGEIVGGYFILTAPTRDQAERVAATCPHLRHGGRIVLKAIDPV